MGPYQLFATFAIIALIVFSTPSVAVEPNEVLPDAAQEARARDLSQHLRCLVCQNQSIDDSNAPLARDFRRLLRERIKAGDTDRAAVDFIVARYGNFVLLKPPFQIGTLLLWFGPGLVLLLALACYWMLIRRPFGTTARRPETLSAAEREELQAIMTKGTS
ncbi:MAG: cytochrome c-type biogenesis protein [Hyphomicrobiales bacterium]|nr:cytochrome c-type biogenesis protein [Hyphomicrobiales bacterium]